MNKKQNYLGVLDKINCMSETHFNKEIDNDFINKQWTKDDLEYFCKSYLSDNTLRVYVGEGWSYCRETNEIMIDKKDVF